MLYWDNKSSYFLKAWLEDFCYVISLWIITSIITEYAMKEHFKISSYLMQKHEASAELNVSCMWTAGAELDSKNPPKIQLNTLIFVATKKKIHLLADTPPHQSTYAMKTQKIKDKIQLNCNRTCDMLESQKKHHAENMLSSSLWNKKIDR